MFEVGGASLTLKPDPALGSSTSSNALDNSATQAQVGHLKRDSFSYCRFFLQNLVKINEK